MSMAQQSPSVNVNDMDGDGDGSSCSSSPISSSSSSSSTSISPSVTPTSDPSRPAKTAKVKVAIRVRPLIPKEIQAGEKSKWRTNGRSIVQINPRTNLPARNHRNAPAYTFDATFGPDQDTKQVYTAVVAPIVEKALQGFNGTVLCYGQTSSGKTHTLYGDDGGENPGIISLMADELFARIGNDGERKYSLRIGLLEIYNEKLADLLNRQNPIEDVEVDGVVVPRNLTEIEVTTPDQILEAVRRVQRQRRAEETAMNTKSSRSHTILRIVIETVPRAPKMSKPTQDEDNNQAMAPAVNSDSPETETENYPSQSHLTKSVLNFVDLAGSEKLSSTGESKRLSAESIYIRKSLTSLCQVVNELSKGRYMPVIKSTLSMPGRHQNLDVIYKTPTTATTTSRSLKPIDIDIPNKHMSHTASSILKQKSAKFKSKPNTRSQLIPIIWRPTIFRKKSGQSQQRQHQPLPVDTVVKDLKPKSKPKSGKSSKLRRTSTYTVSSSMKNSVPIPGLPLKRHINYRDSKLTRILQSSLEGNAFVTMICNLAPAYVPESRATLRFAKTAKKIKMDPVQNKFLITCPPHSNGNGNDTSENESTNVNNKHNTAASYDIQILELVKHLKEKSDEIEKLQRENSVLKSCHMFSSVSPAPEAGPRTTAQAQSEFKSIAKILQPGHFGDDDDDEVHMKSQSRPRTRSEAKRNTSTSTVQSHCQSQKLNLAKNGSVVRYDISAKQKQKTTPRVKIQETRTPRKSSTGPGQSQKLHLVENESVVRYDILATQVPKTTPRVKVQEKQTPRKSNTGQTKKLLNLMENVSVVLVRNDTVATQLQTTTPKTKNQTKKQFPSKESASASGEKRTKPEKSTKTKASRISPKNNSKFLNVRHSEWTNLKKEAKYLKQIVADRTRESLELETKLLASQESIKAKDILLQNAEQSAKLEIANQHHKNEIARKLQEERFITSSQKVKASHLKEIDSLTMEISKLSTKLETQEGAFLQKITILNQEISKLTLSLEEAISSGATQNTAHAQELQILRVDFKLEISKMAKTLRETRGSAKLTEMTLNETIESLKVNSIREISILTKNLEEKEQQIDTILAEYQNKETDVKEELEILKKNFTREICELSESLKTSQDLNGAFKAHFDRLTICKEEFASTQNDGFENILGEIAKLELLEMNSGGNPIKISVQNDHDDHDHGDDGGNVRENLLELIALGSSISGTTTTADAMQLLPNEGQASDLSISGPRGELDGGDDRHVTFVVPDANSVLRKANFWDDQIPKKIKIKFRNQQ